jgi:DNA-binding HxlR family transcriptional regulator
MTSPENLGTKCGGVPDMRWINRNLSITEVAKMLELRTGAHGLIHCWHPERHHNGDRTASVGVRKNVNTVKCFGAGCGVGPLGPIDLVVDALGLNGPSEAALWIAERFKVPRIPKRKHLKEQTRPPARAGFEGDIGLLVQSGLWAELSAPTRSIAPVLLLFADREPGKATATVTVSYRAIGRYSGVVSPNSISRAIRELEEIGWLKKLTKQSTGAVAETSGYVLYPQGDDLMELANMRARQMRGEIEAEKVVRGKQREARRRSRVLALQEKRGVFTKYESLYPLDSDEQDGGIHGVAVFENSLSATRPSPGGV